MNKKSILFISTNPVWGGSEVLWARSAKTLQTSGYQVKAAAMYSYEKLKEFIPVKENYIDLTERFVYPGLMIKLFKKIAFGVYNPKDKLEEWIKTKKPALVVISQGNNVIGHSFMELCNEQKIPFVTLTHLIPERIWPTLDEDLISRLRSLYKSSKKNYFVSTHNLLLHEKILGEHFPNAAITYNPAATPINNDMPFPSLENGRYKIALVGRIEFFHKGQDLLLDIVKQEKWKNRNVVFSIFGDGPHLQLLTRLIGKNGITNIIVHKHVDDISVVWKEHHILLMPSRMEGQSVALIEAMHHKRTAIVTRVGGVDELIEDEVSGFIADAPTVNSIDDALERAWNRRTEWAQMGMIAKMHILKKHPPDPVAYFNVQLQEFL